MTQSTPLEFEQPLGTTIGGFVVGHRARMSRCDAVGTIVGLQRREGTGPVVTLHFDTAQPVDFPEGATSHRFSMDWRSVTSTWRAPFPFRAGGHEEGIENESVEALRELAHEVHEQVNLGEALPGVQAARDLLVGRPAVLAAKVQHSAGDFVHVLAELETGDARYLLWSGTEGDVGVDPWPAGIEAGKLDLAFDWVAANDPPSGSVVFVEALDKPEPSVRTTFPGIR